MDETGEPIKDIDNIFVSYTSIYDNDDKTLKVMYPNDARLKNLTYKGSILFYVILVFIIYSIMKVVRSVIKNFEKD